MKSEAATEIIRVTKTNSSHSAFVLTQFDTACRSTCQQRLYRRLEHMTSHPDIHLARALILLFLHQTEHPQRCILRSIQISLHSLNSPSTFLSISTEQSVIFPCGSAITYILQANSRPCGGGHGRACWSIGLSVRGGGRQGCYLYNEWLRSYDDQDEYSSDLLSLHSSQTTSKANDR